jgi:hypothetical protein
MLLLAACGGEADPPVDAGPCWPLNATPGGEVEIGTGDIDFEPLSDTLEIISSPAQSDPFVEIHSRIRGLPPGDPDDILSTANPKTKINLVIESLGLTLGVDCPANFGYVAATEPGAFDMVHSLHVGFGFMPIDDVPGKQGRITIEVVGSNRRYAKAEKLVTLTASMATAP